MSKIKKRFAQIISSPNNTKWDEIKPILKYYGFVCEKPNSGSHWKVYHPNGEDILTIPVHSNRIKTVYVRKLIGLIESVAEED